MVERIALVSCVKTKAERACQARDLYTSAWFTKARSLIERSRLTWFILSAEHGLVDPQTVIAPYEKTLNKMGAGERKAWAERVIGQMATVLPDADEIILLAGQRYRDGLMPYLQARFPKVSIPMEGLTSGRQLNWLSSAKSL
jgi:hypothetical protein